MSKRMLIDASHPEETRVVVLDGNKVEEFDFESASRRPLKGNIYLAKVTRVEPSLQAAFVEYGGNRQGFLAFSEIHPDYYQIPIADRQALLEAQTQRMMADDEEGFEAVATAKVSRHEAMPGADGEQDSIHEGDHDAFEEQAPEHVEHSDEEDGDEDASPSLDIASTSENEEAATAAEVGSTDIGEPNPIASDAHEDSSPETGSNESVSPEQPQPASEVVAEATGAPVQHQRRGPRQNGHQPRRRHYKIQEVIKRRQILLVQVVKEERGNKGASLTTFLSLAGRYCVLMPNTPRGGGISRKITNAVDRKRLKSAAQSLELPEGMGLIIRTAGANRTKLEIKRDYEYLLRLWDTVREVTLKSNAPALVYEEGSLIKRAIRDLYNKDISEVVVDGDAGYRDAKDFMRMIMPSHAKNVKPYKDTLPLFQRYQTEAQLDSMFSPTVTLKSGGYIVINQTEALVSIDVNSGKATREHSIEETAHKTNLEAADEIARQLRLRDLAGLIVIDFIDMEDSKNDRNVEKRLYNAVKGDRARIQIGKISQFGLLEMSRQRLRAGVVAGSTIPCPHCAGMGIIRSTESAALKLIRALDEEGQRAPGSVLRVKAPEDVSIYTLNHKRREIARIEDTYEMEVTFDPQAGMFGANFEVVRMAVRALTRPKSTAVTVEAGFETNEPEPPQEQIHEEEIETDTEEAQEEREDKAQPSHETQHGNASEGEGGRRRRRRRRRGGQGRGENQGQNHQQRGAPQQPHHAHQDVPAPESSETGEAGSPPHAEVQGAEGDSHGARTQQSEDGKRRRRRRGRRGRRRDGDQATQGQHGGTDAAGEMAPQAEENFPHAAQAEPMGLETITPNAPSSPQWSLTEQAQEPRESAPAMDFADAHAPHAMERPERPAPVMHEEAELPKEPRKGWWQRRFGG
jgi:ribonuclease E